MCSTRVLNARINQKLIHEHRSKVAAPIHFNQRSILRSVTVNHRPSSSSPDKRCKTNSFQPDWIYAFRYSIRQSLKPHMFQRLHADALHCPSSIIHRWPAAERYTWPGTHARQHSPQHQHLVYRCMPADDDTAVENANRWRPRTLPNVVFARCRQWVYLPTCLNLPLVGADVRRQ